MKILRALLVAAAVLFLLVVNLSVVETALLCSGVISAHGFSRPGKALVTIRSYRPWISVWTEKKGYIWMELPEQSGTCHVYFRNGGELVRISDRAAGIEGVFSVSTRILHLQTPEWSFDAACGSTPSESEGGASSPDDL